MKTRFPVPVPKSTAQLTGVVVTAIVAFGTDMDVYYAMPLGIFAGALAVFFVSLSEGQAALQTAYQTRLERLK
ncbi:MAG TPA: hypothetical protein VLL04_12995 [Rhizomicrobium sp.]|nr:hypothetical protein [Rhizomicrobium sp.]